MKCIVDNEDCVEGISGRNLCHKHYQRWYRNGSPHIVRPKGGFGHKLPKGHAARNKAMARAKRQAERRGFGWELTDDEVEELFQGDCFYCGVPPSQVYEEDSLNGAYTYNGIDRIDNDKDYTPDNTVSCCAMCNYMKKAYSQDEFINQCKMVAANQ